MKTASKKKIVGVLQSGDVRLWNRYVKWCRMIDGEWKANLRGSDLRGTDLSGANLRGSDLREADLRGSDLRGTDLREADLRGSDLREADLRGSDLRGTDLSGANLRGSDLSGTDLDFSSWPLWCGGTIATVDRRLSLQLIYHAFNQRHQDLDIRAALEYLRPLAQEFRDRFRGDAPELRR